MATKTFLELQTALSSMWGYDDPADLTAPDLADIKSYINAAYFDVFAPVDGSRPNYSEQYFSKILKAPAAVTLGLTNGSTTVTGATFETAYLGSYVKIGDAYYRSGDATHLVQPWAGDTGSYAATVYYNAVALDANVIEVLGVPNLLGIGVLAPLPDPDWELRMRSEPVPDFDSKNARYPFAITRNRFNPSLYYDTGEPRYYYVDSASVSPTFAIGDRMHFYPVPDRAMTVEFRANVIPAAMTSDNETPKMPALAIDNILLPLAKEKLAENTAGRRFTGDVRLIMAAANRARVQLKSLSPKQRSTAGGFRLKRGW